MSNLTSLQFKVSEYVVANEDLMDNKGYLYLATGECAQIIILDPSKRPETPYGLRKPTENHATQYFAESKLELSPNHSRKKDVWTDNPKEYYRHPENPKHEQLRSVGWRVDPATV